jgi:hypothetical protein
MIPAGYMAKRVATKPEWLSVAGVVDIWSVGDCVGEDFADYIEYWKHNGFWLFDSPTAIRSVANEHSISLDRTLLFYYEVYELEFDGENWRTFEPEASFQTNVTVPAKKQLGGFDVVTFWCKNAPAHSPLSCNSLAEEIETNSHCLFASFEEAQSHLQKGSFKDSEPGPYRIFSVSSVDWD